MRDVYRAANEGFRISVQKKTAPATAIGNIILLGSTSLGIRYNFSSTCEWLGAAQRSL